jgi:2-polyprenyl-3-methyl-5-hydroxy-6-metoxy-1,4-benzoquinol methylase
MTTAVPHDRAGAGSFPAQRKRENPATEKPASVEEEFSEHMLRERIKWLLFPGLNLHARLRNRVLTPYFAASSKGAPRRVLDAGCGNGMLAYRSYRLGNRVLGISIKPREIANNKRLFNAYLNIPSDRLEFREWNLYDLPALGMTFDEIICTEVLEHIVNDAEVCRSFWQVLNPGGVLHLCCPNADHPDHQRHALDERESGGHVRAGYTQETYRALLEPIGFELSPPVGLGGRFRQAANKRIIQAEEFGGLSLGMLAFIALGPLAAFDRGVPATPYSLYVRARKP